MKCEFTGKKCDELYDSIDILNTSAGIITEELYFKQKQTGELIKISDIERKHILNNIQKTKNNLQNIFDNCGCFTEEPPEGLGKLFDRKFVKSKYD